MRVRDVLACQITEWYPHFKERTVRTEFVELTEAFVQYLLQDGVVLPTPVGEVHPADPRHRSDGDSEFSSTDSEHEDGEDEGGSDGMVAEVRGSALGCRNRAHDVRALAGPAARV